ncbi:MAG: DNA pilot protein [Microvirus sp.]|nr:MAG: DNA pilot protein [Microvirus sp.]
MGLFDGIASTLVGGALGFLGSDNTNNDMMDIAKMNNATSLDIAKNGMQYKVADLKAAGLNPALAYNSGPINMPNLSTPALQNSGEAAARGMMSGSQNALAKAQIDQIGAQTALNTAQADQVRTNTDIAKLDYAKSLFLKDNYSSWDSAGASIDATRAQSIYDQAKASNDYNTIVFLNDFARGKGFGNYETAVKSTDFLQSLSDLRNTNTSGQLQRLQIPEAQANAAFYSTDFGKKIAPFMSSAKDISSIGSNVIRHFK